MQHTPNTFRPKSPGRLKLESNTESFLNPTPFPKNTSQGLLLTLTQIARRRREKVGSRKCRWLDTNAGSIAL